MTTKTAAPSPSATGAEIRRTVHLQVQPAHAYKMFTTRMREWWNPAISNHPSKSPILEIVFEDKAGGRWYERNADGSEHEWARVTSVTPGSSIVVDWFPNGISTLLEIRFDSPAPRRTDVTIIHRGLEGFGEKAGRMRELHDQCWTDLLSRFAAYVKDHPVGHESQSTTAPARAITDGATVIATVDVPATADRVFRALTTAETEQWWGAPDTYRTTEWQSDVRTGGKWSCVTRLADGAAFPASGEYLTVDAPKRVVQTRRYDWDYPELGRRDTTVTYLLDATPSGTRVTVRQDGFAGMRQPAEHHVEGWEGFLTYLAGYLTAEASR